MENIVMGHRVSLAIQMLSKHDWLIEPRAFWSMVSIIAEGMAPKTEAARDKNALFTTMKVGIVPVKGILMNSPTDIEMMAGAIDAGVVKRKIAEAVSNPDIAAVVLDIDSPGGTVDGSADLAESVYAMRNKKTIISHTSNMAASAAYWLASSAKTITASPTAFTGSIGVYMEHIDATGYYEQMGIKPTLIYAGRNKVSGAQGYPLSDEDRSVLQARVDEIYSMFTSAISRNRGIGQDKIVNEIGADVYSTDNAIAIGLVDRKMSLEQTVEYAAMSAFEREDMQIDSKMYSSAALLDKRVRLLQLRGSLMKR